MVQKKVVIVLFAESSLLHFLTYFGPAKSTTFPIAVVAWLKECNVVQESYCLQMATALGLRPDVSNVKLEINYYFLQARFFYMVLQS